MYILDMDGTMINSNGVWKQVDIDFLAKRNLPYTKEYYEGVGHTIFPIAAKFTKEYCHLEESEEEIMAEWMEMAGDVYQHIPIKPYVYEFLNQEKVKGTRMIVLTSSVPEHAKTALEHLNLFPYFEKVFYAAEMGIDKKSPEIYKKVVAQMGEIPENCTLLDDSIASIESAKSIGIHTIGVFDNFFSAHEEQMKITCEKYIYSFKELLDK